MPVMTVGTGRALIPTGIKYNDKVLATGPIAYWPQSETAGVTAHCLVNPLQDGTYTGVTLANDNTGPFGTPAPFYDGANDYCNILTAALNAAFNGAQGTSMVWGKVNAAGVWADATIRYLVHLFSGAANFIYQQKTAAVNGSQLRYIAGGVSDLVNVVNGTTDWFQYVLTWDKAGEELRAYLNGAQFGLTQINLGVWAGALIVASIGSYNLVPASPWHGWLGPVGLWDRTLTPAEVATVYAT